MTSVKLSPKGKALRKNRWLSSRVVRAIVMDDDNQLYSEEGLKVYDENGRFLITVKGATEIKKPENIHMNFFKEYWEALKSLALFKKQGFNRHLEALISVIWWSIIIILVILII